MKDWCKDEDDTVESLGALEAFMRLNGLQVLELNHVDHEERLIKRQFRAIELKKRLTPRSQGELDAGL